MMNEALSEYLQASYSKDVLHKAGEVIAPVTQEAIDAAKTELARINALGLGANLAQRDFVAYQHKKALEKLLQQTGD